MKNEPLVIYTDGACEPNPGPGGFGVVLLYESEPTVLSHGYRKTTNNRMELMAAIAALEALDDPPSVALHSDSKYLVDAMTFGWARSWRKAGWVRKGGRKVPNADLWGRLLDLDDRYDVTYVWIRGHSGDRFNEMADALSYQAIDSPDKSEDPGYLKQLDEEKQQPQRISEAGQPCRKCQTPVVKRKPKRRLKKGQGYYFEYYFYCPNCGTVYTVDAAKRYLDQH